MKRGYAMLYTLCEERAGPLEITHNYLFITPSLIPRFTIMTSLHTFRWAEHHLTPASLSVANLNYPCSQCLKKTNEYDALHTLGSSQRFLKPTP